MLKAQFVPYKLDFTFEARTSRAVMNHKDTYFVKVWDDSCPAIVGVGECALFKGLSKEDNCDYENLLAEICRNPLMYSSMGSSSIKFGFETALADLKNGRRGLIYPDSRWVKGNDAIPINGLVWMGDRNTMFERIKQKLEQGFRCLKLKIGGICFDDEIELLKYVRQRFSHDVLELRLDANGAFTIDNALQRIEKLSRFSIHSLEQPIKAGQYDKMEYVCRYSPVPIALDEELIGDTSHDFKEQLINYIRPAYVILKPSLCGGFQSADEWIDVAEKAGIEWWATSALESNIGLSAIGQWVATKGHVLCQGLGTGELYSNNIPSPVFRKGPFLYFNPDISISINDIFRI